MLNEDYRDILHALLDEKVEFLVVGAFAMAAHGYLRATLDIDIWVRTSPQNAEAVLRALDKYGAPLLGLTLEDLQKDDTVFQIGIAPRRVDIITEVSGLHFIEAYTRSVGVRINAIEVRVPSLDDLILNKRASGRPRDLADAEELEALRDSGAVNE